MKPQHCGTGRSIPGMAGLRHELAVLIVVSGRMRPQLTTGCTCREAPGWYPGRPAAALCPIHGSHRRTCPAVPLLSRSRHQEGCGWRCPDCGATYTLTRIQDDEHPIRLYPTLKWIRNT